MKTALLFRRRAAPWLLVLGAIAYLVTWQLDPYIYGFTVLGLAPLQLGVAVIGVLARAIRVDRDGALAAWVVDALLVAVSAAALAAARSISWT